MVTIELIMNFFTQYTAIEALGIFLVYMWVLLLGLFFYVQVTDSWNRLKIGIKILVSPFVLVFGIADVLFDMVAGTIMYLELPLWQHGRVTFSQRCEYHMNDSGFRGVIAGAYCFTLNSIDPGHCRK